MNEQKNKKKLNMIIIALILLLLVSGGALTARVIYLKYFAPNSTTTVVPDNLIGENTSTNTFAPDSSENSSPSVSTEEDGYFSESISSDTTPSAFGTFEYTDDIGSAAADTKAAVIKLYKGRPSDNESFQVTNMLPGDTEVKYFAVKVSHSADAIVYFNAEVTEQTKNLADVLHIKVTHLESKKVLYNGTFADMNTEGYGETFATTGSTETVAYYKIEVSMPASAGNEYQAAKLMADFSWTVKDTGALDSPPTGDRGNTALLLSMMLSAITLVVVLLFFRRREKEDEYAEQN